MYERLEQVARDMAAVDDATSENLVSDIVGELAGLIEIEEILDQSGLADVERSEERVEEALRRARESSEMQRILFQHAVSYDANELQSSFAMRSEERRDGKEGVSLCRFRWWPSN